MATLGGKYIMVILPGNDLASKKEIIWYTTLSHHFFSDKTSNCPMVQTACESVTVWMKVRKEKSHILAIFSEYAKGL